MQLIDQHWRAAFVGHEPDFNLLKVAARVRSVCTEASKSRKNVVYPKCNV